MPVLNIEEAMRCAELANNLYDISKGDMNPETGVALPGVYPERQNMGSNIGVDPFDLIGSPHAGTNAPLVGQGKGFDGSNAFIFKGHTALVGSSPLGAVLPGEAQRVNEAMITFRGSCYLTDYLANLAFSTGISSKGYPVHGGFNELYQSCRGRILWSLGNLQDRRKNIRELHIAGHSLGGALATLCAEDLIGRGYTIYLYTFGAPRVGLGSHAEYMWEELGPNIHRYYYSNDPITWLPIFPYTHLPGIKLTTSKGSGFFMRGCHGDYFKEHYLAIKHRETSRSVWISSDLKEEVNKIKNARHPGFGSLIAIKIAFKLLGLILRTAIGIVAYGVVTLVDQIAWLLIVFGRTSRAHDKVMVTFTKYVMKILGIPLSGLQSVTQVFLNYMLDRLFSMVCNHTQQELLDINR